MVTGFNFVRTHDDMVTLLQNGPVTIAVDSTYWRNYKRGIFEEADPSSYTLNHAVLIVGYGEENGIPYWTVRNSWGDQWGEEGYIRIKRFTGNNPEYYNF